MSQSQYVLNKKEISKMRDKSRISDIENEKTYVDHDDVYTIRGMDELIICNFIGWFFATLFSMLVCTMLSLIAVPILHGTTSHNEDVLTKIILYFTFGFYLFALIFTTVVVIYFYISTKRNYVTYKNDKLDNDLFTILNKPIVLTNENKVDRLWHYLNVEQSTTDTFVFDLGKQRPFKFINAYPKFKSDDETAYYQEAIAHYATFVEKMDVPTYQHIYDIIQANEDRKQQKAEQNRKAKAYNGLSPTSVDEQQNSQVMQSLQRLKQTIEEGQSDNKQHQKDALTKNENIRNHIDEGR